MLMRPFNTGHTSHWMLPRRSPHSWSMTCLTRLDFSRLWVVSLRQPPKQRSESILALWLVENVRLSCGRKVSRTPRFGLNNSGTKLATTFGVDILCGYALSSFHGEEDKHVFQSICAEHTQPFILSKIDNDSKIR